MVSRSSTDAGGVEYSQSNIITTQAERRHLRGKTRDETMRSWSRGSSSDDVIRDGSGSAHRFNAQIRSCIRLHFLFL